MPQEVAPATRSTVFDFEHKVFKIAGGRFALSRTNGLPVYYVPLGELEATLPLESLCAEFAIRDESPDALLLGVIERSLHHVKEIRSGDSIPRELLDGTASWSVEERHRAIAHGRIASNILCWLTEGEEAVFDLTRLIQLAEDPAVRARVQEATGKIAQRLNLPEGEAGRQAVVSRTEDLARELAYIEALRERVAAAAEIAVKLHTAGRLYKRDHLFADEIRRMHVLIRPPLARMAETLTQTDAQTGEVLAVLRNFDAQIQFIRTARDDLHGALMPWDDAIAGWAIWGKEHPLECGPELQALVRQTYAFLARNFVQVSPWVRAG